ncbi:MAG: 23S rRNA (guanosine(2251)-2'-O)-methyltransferase RlmB [Thermodesulfobacteriota bacterium]
MNTQPAAGDDTLWGIHPVLEQLRLRPRSVREVVIQQGRSGKNLQEIIELARQQGVKVRFLPGQRFPSAPGKVHQGVLARVAPVSMLDLDSLLDKLGNDPARPPLLVALDSIQDPHNLGAIIRTAAAAGASGVILPKDRSAPMNATAAKSAAGATAHLDLCTVTNLASSLRTLKEHGFWVYGAAGEAAGSLYATRFEGPICLVIGGEGKGLRPLIREQCDHLVAIPMAGSLNSLNASVAAGVILFEMVRQRQDAAMHGPAPSIVNGVLTKPRLTTR